MDGFAFALGLHIALAGTHGFDGGEQPGKDGRIGDGHVVRTEHNLDLGLQRGDAFDGSDVGVQISFRAIQPDGRGVVGIAGKEQAVRAIEQANCVGSMAGRGDDLQDVAGAEIDFKAVVYRQGNFPRLGGVVCGIESFGRVAAEQIFAEFGLRIVA